MYFGLIGDEVAEGEAWRDACVAKPDGGCWASTYAAHLYEHGQHEEALEVVNCSEARTAEVLMARAYLLAETPGGRDKALKLYEQLVNEHTSWFVREGAVQKVG